MLFSFLKLKENQRRYIVFTIDTSALTLTLVEKSNLASTKILYIERFSLEMDQVLLATDLLRLINKKINLAFKSIRDKFKKDFLNHRTGILVLVGSPWHIGWSDKLEIKREKPFKLTRELVDSGIKDSFENVHNDLSIVSINVMGYKLNGYNLINPFGKITKSVDLSIYINSAPKEFINSIQRNIKSYLPHNELVFSSYNNAINLSIQSISKSKDYLIITPENETTDLILVKNNSILTEASIPFGGAVLARNLFAKNSSSIKESISKTKRFISGELEVSNMDDLGSELNNIKVQFLNNLRDTLWKMNDSLLLPSNVYIVGKNIATHFVHKWVIDEEYTNKTFTTEGFSVVNIRGNDVCQLKAPSNIKLPLASAVAVLSVNMLK